MSEVPPDCEEISRENFKAVISRYDTILICVDGVLWRQDGVDDVAGAGNACNWLAKEGKEVFFLTNRDNKTRYQSKISLFDCGFRLCMDLVWKWHE